MSLVVTIVLSHETVALTLTTHKSLPLTELGREPYNGQPLCPRHWAAASSTPGSLRSVQRPHPASTHQHCALTQELDALPAT